MDVLVNALNPATSSLELTNERNIPTPIFRYGAALLAAIAALFLYKLLTPVLDGQNPYHTAWAAVVFSAWYCGVGPSIIVVLLDLIGIWYWFLPPVASFQLANPRADIAGMLGFVAFSGFIVALGGANRRSLAKSRLAEEQRRSAHTELEGAGTNHGTEQGE